MDTIASTRFAGFPAAALRFLAGLERENTKAYFDAHREVYEHAIREPVELLLAEAAEEFGGTPKLFRAQRDLRFAKDRRPYRTDVVAGLGDRESAAVRYLRLTPEGLAVGGGAPQPSSAHLRAARETLAEDPDAAAGLEAVLIDLTRSGFELAGGMLRTAPRGFPRDHPRVELLRRTAFAAERLAEPGPELHDPDRARAFVLGAWRSVEPLHAWLERHAASAADGAHQ